MKWNFKKISVFLFPVVVSLQSLNTTLQSQLKESLKGLESLQNKNEELLKIIQSQKEENKQFAKVIQEKDKELLENKQQFDIQATKLKIGMFGTQL